MYLSFVCHSASVLLVTVTTCTDLMPLMHQWLDTIAAITNGIRKFNAKNRVSVALSTANPPHTH